MGRAVKPYAAIIDPYDTRAKTANLVELMRYKNNGSPSTGYVVHFVEALSLKIDVTNRENFIDKENLGIEMSCNRKCKADVHTGGVMLHGRINEFLKISESDDFFEFSGDFVLAHAEDGAGEKSILATGKLRMEAGANFKERAYATANLSPAGSWAGNPRKNL